MAEIPEQGFSDSLRAAVLAYLQAVDQWEAAYRKYYRLPGYAQRVSPDMDAEQREYEARRRDLELLLPRVRQLCLRYGLRDPFPNLIRTSLGEYAAQHRTGSAIGRNERNATVDCLDQLAGACRGEPVKVQSETEEGQPTRRPSHSGVYAILLAGAFLAGIACLAIAFKWGPSGRQPVESGAAIELHGARSGNEIYQSAEAERRKATDRFSDRDLQEMVERLFVESDPGRANFLGLLYAGRRPVPLLIKALNDPRTATKVFFREGFHLYGMSPFERICELLDQTAPPEAVAALGPYLNHHHPGFRRQAALVLAKIGVLAKNDAADRTDLVKKALADPDHEVRAYALMGLLHGLEKEQRNEAFLHGVYPAIVPLLDDGVYDLDGPARLLMEIDAEKTAPILESPRYCNARNPQLYEVLIALDFDELKVPHQVLLPLLAELEPLAANAPRHESDYAAALILYAKNPDGLAASRFQAAIGSASSTIAESAARGLEILAGINPHSVSETAYGEHGFAAMTEAQRFYHAIEDYRDEVCNGGHHQYFYNSTSDIYEVALAGLRAIGAESKRTILADALQAFAPGRAATENAFRRKQMELFGDFQGRIFAGADERFFGSEERAGERLAVLLMRYGLSHKSDFVEVRKMAATTRARKE